MDGKLVLEKDIERRLGSLVKQHGGKYIKFYSSAETGIPDRVVVLPGGVVIFVELKRPKGGKLSAMQKYQIEQLRDLDCWVEVVKNYEQIDELFQKYEKIGG